MDLKQFKIGVAHLAEEKDIPKERVIEIIEGAVAAAYKKDYGDRAQNIEAQLDLDTGAFQFWQVKEVVDEEMILSEEELEKLRQGEEIEEKKVRFHPQRHILLEEARKENKEAEVGDEVRKELPIKGEYGRIAAQTAKQVILQRLKETERDMLYDEYKEKEGSVVSGSVQRVTSDRIYFDLGKVLGFLTRDEQIPGEFYKIGERFKLYVLKIEEGTKGPIIYLSRAFPKLISELFALEVPEISSGKVEIKAIAREPGARTKMAVTSYDEDIDPIGATIGQRGSRVTAVISELGGEKIDIIEYAEDSQEFIKNALSPAKVLQVEVRGENKVACIVPDDELSLAIGKNGQNVRLATKLTGWKIDVRSIKDWEKEQGSGQNEEEIEEKENNEEKESEDKDKEIINEEGDKEQ